MEKAKQQKFVEYDTSLILLNLPIYLLINICFPELQLLKAVSSKTFVIEKTIL